MTSVWSLVQYITSTPTQHHQTMHIFTSICQY